MLQVCGDTDTCVAVQFNSLVDEEQCTLFHDSEPIEEDASTGINIYILIERCEEGKILFYAVLRNREPVV